MNFLNSKILCYNFSEFQQQYSAITLEDDLVKQVFLRYKLWSKIISILSLIVIKNIHVSVLSIIQGMIKIIIIKLIIS